MNSVGRSACRRGPSLARKTSAASSSRRASQKAARPGEPASSPVSISQTALKPSLPPRGAMAWRSAARLMLCWPLLSAVPRPYQRSPSTRSVQDRGRRPSAPRCRAPRRRVHTAARWAGPGLRCAAPPGWAGRRRPGCRGCDRQSPGRPAAAPCRRADRRAARPPGRLPRSRSERHAAGQIGLEGAVVVLCDGLHEGLLAIHDGPRCGFEAQSYYASSRATIR